MSHSVEEMIIHGDFESAYYHLRQKENVEAQDYYIKGIAAFYAGLFIEAEESFKEALKLANSKQDDSLAKDTAKLLEIIKQSRMEFEPPYLQAVIEQSREDSSERYEELYFLEELLNPDEEIRKKKTNELLGMLKDPQNKIRAYGNFIAAEVFSRQGNVKNALTHYLVAINLAPNKALYWGFCAQYLYQQKLALFDAVIFLRKAEELDGDNARWPFLIACVLGLLATEDYYFIKQARLEAENALGLCRKDQLQLRDSLLALNSTYKEFERTLADKGVFN